MSQMRDLLQNLGDQGLTLGCVESMTGGLFAAEATAIPGASSVFKGGIVAYTPAVKTKVIGVPQEMIDEKGVVSADVAQSMAQRGRRLLGADIVLAVTGNAGPTAEPGDAPVGQAYFALASKEGVWTFGYLFSGERNEIRKAAVDMMVRFGFSQVARIKAE